VKRMTMIFAFAAALAASPALAGGTTFTDSDGFDHSDGRGESAVQFNDSSGLHREINRSNGRSGTIWRDSNGPRSRYTGRTFEW
jgi:hypothetical protein